MNFQPTVRQRLTIIYAAMFFLAGLALVATNYFIVRESLPFGPGEVAFEVAPIPAFGPPEGLRPEEANLQAYLEEYTNQLRTQTLRTLLLRSIVALGFVGLASAGLGWFAAGRVLRPLHDMTEKARTLSEENLHERLDLRGPKDELKELADTFDGMLERLEQAFDSQKRFVANASHELRTPLAIMRTEIDVALRDPDITMEEMKQMANNVSTAIDRNEHLISSLLMFARSEVLQNKEWLQLDQLVAEAVTQHRTAADRADIDLRAEMSPAKVKGDAALLSRMTSNLLQNAIQYNQRGGFIEVKVAEADGGAELIVSNTGTLVPPEQVSLLLEPFRRGGVERTGDVPGAGLGLSIVRSIAQAHGGGVVLQARPDGGLRVRVTLGAPRSE